MIKKFLQKIFKIFAYSIFYTIYGKIDKAIHCSTDERIKVKVISLEKDFSYKIYEIANGRLYTDRIQDTAAILDNKIIEGPSFQFRQKHALETYNANIKNNIVFTKGTPRFLKNLNGTVLSLLTGGAGNDNYWHWLFDVLPRIGLFRKNMNLSEVDYFLLPSLTKNFQNETLDLLSIPKQKRLSSEKIRHLKAKKLILTDHPVVTTDDSSGDIQNVPRWIILWLKNNFLNKESLIKKKQKIYIDRNESTSNRPQRLISNENEIRKYLLKNDFIPVKLGEIKFREQVKLFNNAEYVVGLHGAGFGNLVFCNPGTRVIEFRNSSTGPMMENLAKKNNLNYSSIIIGKKDLVKSKSVVTKDVKNETLTLTIETAKHAFVNQQGSIEIPISSLIKILEN